MNIQQIFKGRFSKSFVLAVADAVMLISSFVMACALSGYPLARLFDTWLLLLPVAVAFQLLIFLRFGLYKAILRYASVDSIVIILKAVTASTFAVVLGLYVIQKQLPINVLLLYWLITICFIGGSRFVVRYYFDLRQRFQTGRRALIYGAGDMGSLALRQLYLNKALLYSPVGFIDDDKKKVGSVIRGVKVLGSLEDIENIVQRYKVEEVVVAIAEVESDKLRDVVKRCKTQGIVCRIIPCFSRLLEIEPDIRNVELEDLMRRTPRDLDKEAIGKYLYQKTILITGAAGSIGSEMVRQCLSYHPKVVIALDQSEYGLYALEEELTNANVRYVLCDVTNYSNLETIFAKYMPDIVFHAAAYKHVPLLEKNPVEGIRNNVTSTKNLCELSDKYKAKSFVMISTDKAVRPSSIMGATKRISELFVQNFDRRSETEYVSVRFGNVLGSSGSVVPKFINQIRKGGPVTVTHPEATRYFMLIDEAVQLVLQAGSIGKGGEIFILDMGKPVKIVDMAEDLIYLMGRQPYKDIDIQFSGMRAGEKIHEELFNDEIEEPTMFKEITIGRSQIVDWELLDKNVRELLSCTREESCQKLMSMIESLVPDGNFSHNMKTLRRDENVNIA